MKYLYNIKNKTVFITGANGYLGTNLINFFRDLNVNIIATDKEISKANKKIIDKINFRKKNSIQFIKCDLSNLLDRNYLLEIIKKKKN